MKKAEKGSWNLANKILVDEKRKVSQFSKGKVTPKAKHDRYCMPFIDSECNIVVGALTQINPLSRTGSFSVIQYSSDIFRNMLN